MVAYQPSRAGLLRLMNTRCTTSGNGMTRSLLACWVVLVALGGVGCQTLREIAALRDVDFALDRVSDAHLAGVRIEQIRNYEDLGPADVLRLTAAVANNNLPLEFELHLMAENPPENQVDARLVQMDWTLLLDDKETISGVFDDTVVLRPGQPADISIPIRLDLVDFFNDGARDLIELALAVGGQGGEPRRVTLQATPTIDTAIGPIRYPNPITIVSREVGS